MRTNPKILKGLFGIGAVAGVIATAYFSARKGQRITEVTDEIAEKVKASEDKPSKIKTAVKSVPDFVKVAWEPLLCMGGTFTCMAISRKITIKQIAALTATCAYVTRNRNYLEQKLKEYISDEDLAKIKKEFAKKEIVEKIVYKETPEISSLCTGEDPGVLCYESIIGRWFRCPKNGILQGEEYVEKVFEDLKYCCMNDLYGFWGIAMSHPGQAYGWFNNEDYYTKLEFRNTMLGPEEWNGSGPDGKELKEPVFVIEPDSWSLPMIGWEEL